MKTDSPFLPLDTLSSPKVPVLLDGQTINLPKGMNLAAALLACGITTFRHTPLSQAPRAPFCMMGTCFECILHINGVPTQACMVKVEEGLAIVRPQHREQSQ
jgi:predicted molibdopterin-dependent oxidoreductase YjgC